MKRKAQTSKSTRKKKQVRAGKGTGSKPDTDLIELALVSIEAGDDYVEWLLARRGTISLKADLDF